MLRIALRNAAIRSHGSKLPSNISILGNRQCVSVLARGPERSHNGQQNIPSSLLSSIHRQQQRYMADDSVATPQEANAKYGDGQTVTVPLEEFDAPRNADESDAGIESTADENGFPESNEGGESKMSGYQDRSNVTPNKNVYIGNLFFDLSENDIREMFAKAGPIRKVKIMTDMRGFSKGFGYVEFEDVESATKAIEKFHRAELGGRTISVQYSFLRLPRFGEEGSESTNGFRRFRNAPSKTVFVGNIHFNTTDSQLHELFKDMTGVVDVRIAVDRRTGQPRGFAHADFADVESAQKAADLLTGKTLHERNLRIDFAEGDGRPSRSFQYSRGRGREGGDRGDRGDRRDRFDRGDRGDRRDRTGRPRYSEAPAERFGSGPEPAEY